jgi:hypothetical protein
MDERVARRAVPSEAFVRSVSEIRMRGYANGYETGWRDGYEAGKTDAAENEGVGMDTGTTNVETGEWEPSSMPPVVRRYSFSIELPLTEEDIDDAGGDLLQAAQNIIGHTGAVVDGL